MLTLKIIFVNNFVKLSFSACMNMRKSFTISHMARGLFILGILTAIGATCANAASVRGVSTASRGGNTTAVQHTANPTSGYTYNYMYPYLNNQMRTTLNPGVTTSQSTSPINTVVRTEQLSAPRRVVARTAKSNNTATQTTQRRVVARPNTARVATDAYRPTAKNNHANAIQDNFIRGEQTPGYNSTLDGYRPTDTRDNGSERDNAIVGGTTRGQLTSEQRSAAVLTTYPDTPVTSSTRCMADYSECMDRYCERADAAYNRCYCSAKLAQIDAEYKPALDTLIKQIIELKNGGESWSDAEMNEYWMSTIGQYTGDNSWQKLDDLLDIDWASMESRVRGQNAFATGHEYCVQHLQGCFYMSSNLRDAYRSKISTDCATYESSLRRLKNAAESVLEAYRE